MIDWLGTRYGRLAAFFLLYVTEGIPLGYTAVFVATLMRREGVDPSEIGTFVAMLYLPWSFKWAAGPFVDLFRSQRLGARRVWIVGTQFLMTVALMSLAAMNVLKGVTVADVSLFTTVVVASNIFGAIQDVAIDALAVDTLRSSERGLANGLMFAGASVGNAIGGSGALYLVSYLDFWGSTLFVGGALMLVLVFVSLCLRERPIPGAASLLSMEDFIPELTSYLRTALSAFLGSKMGLLGLVLALLPAGGHALGLALQTNLAVELGLDDDQVATLNLVSTLAFAVFCAGGGWLSDYFGRLRSLAIFIFLTAIPTLLLAWLLYRAGWIMPIDPTLPNRPTPPDWLITAFWAATILFNMANGLMYGTRSAFFMDFCDPKVAATQFTAYMALMNLVISYTAFWQGYAIEAFGYPITLVLDAAGGLLCLAVLAVVPFARRVDGPRLRREPLPPETAQCPVCGRDISPEDIECLACGEPLRI